MKTILIQNADRAISKRDYDQFNGDLLVTSYFSTIQGEGPYAGYPAMFVRLAGCNYGAKDTHCDFCFPEDHAISTPEKGRTTFGNLNIGDSLYALDENGKLTTTKIKNKIVREVPSEDVIVLKIDVDGRVKTLVCTKDHPIHTSTRGFVPAGKLLKSDRIVHLKHREAMAFKMKMQNPSFDPTIVQKITNTRANKLANGEYDFSRSAEAKKNYSKAKQGNKNPMKRHDVRLANTLSHRYPKSKLETSYEELFQNLGIKAQYIGGDIKLPIGNDTDGYRFPDFKLVGKKVIEVYDIGFRYTRNGKRTRRNARNYEEPTREFYESHGHQVLFLTQKDLPWKGVGSGNKASVLSYAKLKEKIVAFQRNGAKLLSIAPLRTSGRKIIKENGMVDVVNFSCAPYNTFVVNDIHTHNCDTGFEFDKGQRYTPEQLLAMLYRDPDYHKSQILVITGGEPTLQHGLLSFIVLASQHFAETQIETNGTQPKFYTAAVERNMTHLFKSVVSPKANYQTGKYTELPGDVTWWAHCLKFVVSADPASAHHEVPEWAFKLGKTIYVSPMAVYKKAYSGEVSSIWDAELIDQEATAANYNYAAQYAMKHHLRLSLQTHLFTGLA